jgi:membrane peptidoglycan carboxypeptidase
MGCLWIFLGTLVTFCGGLTLVVIVLFGLAYGRVDQLVQERVTKIDQYQSFQSTFIYDRSGNQLYEAFGEGRRINVKYADFPDSLIKATVAIEDDSFFTNPGIDVSGTGRALLQYLGLKQGSSGGSTITQQLVRDVLFDPQYRAERTIQRKVEEILDALALTQKKSKQDILEMYLNEIYYGNLAYGAEAAAQTFFGKHVKDLTLCESALLAGLPQAPAELDPLNPDPTIQDAVQTRLNAVLDAMVKVKFITPQIRQTACADGLSFVPPQVSLVAPHFTVYAQSELEQLMRELGYSAEDITRGGLKVYTTVDLRVNQLTQQAVTQQIARLAGNNVTNGASVVISPMTGEILGMVGSVDYNSPNIDGRMNVTIGLRQPGSTMKVFTYSAAMEAGMTPGDVIWDTPTTIDIPGQAPYVPIDYDRTFHGPVRMRAALANSYNIPAVQTLRRVGVPYLLQLLHRFGVTSLNQDPSNYGLSLTLGGGEMSPVELTQGYAVFANQGVLVPVTSILCIVDHQGNIIYQYENGCPEGRQTDKTVNRNALGKQVLDPRIAYIIADIISDNNARAPAMGINSPLRTDGIHTSVKTGTTNDFKDNWTVGFTRNVVIGVWVGNNDGQPMNNVSGLAGAAPIWHAIITGIYGDQNMLNAFAVNGQLAPDTINPPPGMSQRRLCDIRTLSDPATGCSQTQVEWFLDGPPGIPDDNGNFSYPPVQVPQQAPPTHGPYLNPVQPGIYQVLVHPIPPDVAAGISFSVQPGQQPPPPPLYCQVPVELAGAATDAQQQLFIAPPPNPRDAVEAEKYARARGLAFLPTIACSPELLAAQSAQYGPTVVTAVITQPQPGQSVPPQGMPILGTAAFTPDQAQYYVLQVKGGQFPDWVVLGQPHNNSVNSGQLEYLAGSPGLISGTNYMLRLVLVKPDGQFLQAPYVVPFVVQ